jgi:hypothetical protein
MKNYLIIFYAFSIFLFGCNSGLFGLGSKGKQDELKVYENNHAFSIGEIKLHSNETFSYTISNGLTEESFEFVLLKDGEDPILVQHLAQQSGELPESYYFFKSEPIGPGMSKKIKFQAPSKPGLYHYVALSGTPKDSLFGTLVVEPKTKQITGDSNGEP